MDPGLCRDDIAHNHRMALSLPGLIGAALLCACGAASAAPNPACAATAKRASSDARIHLAIDEARRQHRLFGEQTIERDGGMFRVGHHEAEWDRNVGESVPTWERVATFWRALSESAPTELRTSAGLVARSESARTSSDVVVQEALLRAAIVDTPWSAAFISYLMKTAGLSRAEFAFSDTHADYVQAAFEASAAEAAGRESGYAFRACDVATTPPRAGDLLCSTRAETATIARFDALSAALAARAPGQDFAMHCELVVRSDEGGDAKIDAIGGNVVQSVTLTRMTLNEKKVLGDGYISGSPQHLRPHLGRRPWVAVLQRR